MAKKVLVLWHAGCSPDILQPALTELRDKWTTNGAEIKLEHVDRLIMAEYAQSTFDYVLLGVLPPVSYIHNSELLEEIARVMKPSGVLTLKEPITATIDSETSLLRSIEKLMSTLRLAGFINVQQINKNQSPDSLVNEELQKLGVATDNVVIATVECKKPSYEIGTSNLLQLRGRVLQSSRQPAANSESARIWTLAANDMFDDDLDLLDSDTLLDEEDLLRPDPASLKSDCGPSSGRRKACKNCSCGLAEQLEDTSKPVIKTPTSSCGNCYLGDAFRCASCPYLGMPAFKPGEQIKLTDRQLNADQ